jgi:putative hydrolase of the HAD superfamily
MIGLRVRLPHVRVPFTTIPCMDLPSALLVDLDDTVVDDTGTVINCWMQACRAYASELDAATSDQLFAQVDRVRQWYWSDPDRHRRGRLDMLNARREIAGIALMNMGIEDAGLAAKIGADYHARRDAEMTLIAGAVETLRWIRSEGCRLALVSNGGAVGQRDKIARFGLAEFFDAILIEGELGFGKPDERVYRLALAELNANASDTWMIGDNLEWDVAAPQRVSICGVWVDAAGGGVPDASPVRPDRIVRALSDLRPAGRT